MGAAARFLLIVASPMSLIIHRRSSSLFRRLSLHPFSSSTLSPLRRNYTLPLQHLPIKKSSQRLHTQSSSIPDDHYHYSNNHHPWPEWSNFIHTLSHAAEPLRIIPDDSFVSHYFLSQEFVTSATTCLAFARNRPYVLGSLPRKDIEAVVQNGTPFLFQSAADTSRRMREFLGTDGTTVLESDIAQTVDLMKYILSYASNPSVLLEKTDYSIELIESSVRNLLSELAKVISGMPVSEQHQVPSYYRQPPKPFGQNIEMKKGDWICRRCSFMNFARNVKCLECEAARPQGGGEWECPQCDFFNYGKNTVCLRCDCKRPGEASFSTVSSSSGLGYNNGDYANKRHIDSRLAVNEEKAHRWFNQSNNSSDLSSAAADEDFPEIMPLRKGENRFVVSTRRTPLERRLANSQYQRNFGNEVPPEGNDSQNGGSNQNLDTSLGHRLDQINTRTPTFSEVDGRNISGQNTGTMRFNTPRSGSLQDGPSEGSNSGYVPFVPLPADMFAKKTESSSSEKVGAEGFKSVSSEAHNNQRGTVPIGDAFGKRGEHFQLSEKPENTVENRKKEKEQAEKSDGWFNRVAELHSAPDSTNAISDKDFSDIMPMRKGENKFVVSKKKDRSLTSPMYKRQMAMEQANKNNFVPFVPFPPDYFAKKSKPQPDGMVPAVDATEEASGMSPVKSDDARQGYANINREASTENQQTASAITSGAQNSGYQSQSSPGYDDIKNERWSTGDTTRTVFSSQSSAIGNAGSRYAEKDNISRTGELSTGSSGQNFSDSTNAISDEDFPDIMPMRKGENKFVVGKKKDRSLTSPMYKGQMAMEQANKNTFVPFVPFPPDYFAKKSKPQPDGMVPAVDTTEEASGMSTVKSDDARQGYANLNREATTENQQTGSAISSGAQISGYQSQSSPGYDGIKNEMWSTGDTTRTMFSSQSSAIGNAGSRYAEKDNISRTGELSTGSSSQNFSSTQSLSNLTRSNTPLPEAQNYKSGWTGKSLEGSAVKETDPLDMSEEAKAERWFRRVAQIKDSSELSQIPDEDFPSIMPMRKGVNRFVVSKRKTPLERRLTSPQYRRNLPVMSSDHVKKEDDSN